MTATTATPKRCKKLSADARPEARLRAKAAGRLVPGICRACLTCRQLWPHGYGACAGVKGRPGVAGGDVPVCHVDLVTGRRASPLNDELRLVPGQERFYTLDRVANHLAIVAPAEAARKDETT